MNFKTERYQRKKKKYIYIVLFGPVKPELGVIPSGQENHSGAEHLNFPGGEVNVIFLQSNTFFKKKPKTG